LICFRAIFSAAHNFKFCTAFTPPKQRAERKTLNFKILRRFGAAVSQILKFSRSLKFYAAFALSWV